MFVFSFLASHMEDILAVRINLKEDSSSPWFQRILEIPESVASITICLHIRVLFARTNPSIVFHFEDEAYFLSGKLWSNTSWMTHPSFVISPQSRSRTFHTLSIVHWGWKSFWTPIFLPEGCPACDRIKVSLRVEQRRSSDVLQRYPRKNPKLVFNPQLLDILFQRQTWSKEVWKFLLFFSFILQEKKKLPRLSSRQWSKGYLLLSKSLGKSLMQWIGF